MKFPSVSAWELMAWTFKETAKAKKIVIQVVTHK